MRPFHPDFPGPLAWKQGAASPRHFELHAASGLLAELDFPKTFGTLARGRTASHAWTFKRTGFMSPLITARRETESEDCALYHPNLCANQGWLRLSSGRVFEFRLAGVWSRSAILTGDDRREIFRFHLRGDFSAGATMEIRLPDTPSLDLLLLLAWYILVLQMQDEALRSSSQ